MKKEDDGNFEITNLGLSGIELSINDNKVTRDDLGLIREISDHLFDYCRFMESTEELVIQSGIIDEDIDMLLEEIVTKKDGKFHYDVAINFAYVFGYVDADGFYDNKKAITKIEKEWNKVNGRGDIFTNIEDNICHVYITEKKTVVEFLRLANKKWIKGFLKEVV